jgi:hypothetical protein
MTQFSRRDVVDTLIAAAAVTALGSSALSLAQAPDEQSLQDRQLLQDDFTDFQRFIKVSAALTGVDEGHLAPDRNTTKGVQSGADPGQAAKQAYFNLAKIDPGVFKALLHEFETNLGPGAPHTWRQMTDAAAKLLTIGNSAVADLARSIIMAWYFGVWYEWSPPHPPGGKSDNSPKPRFTVVSAEAYTQGWIWRIAQSHAPGYSNLRFGHWAFPPGPGLAIDEFKLIQEAP